MFIAKDTPHVEPIFTVAKLMYPKDTAAEMARALGAQKATVRSWLTGQRRIPIGFIKLLRELLAERFTAMGPALDALNKYQFQREHEPPRRLNGFCAGRERRSLQSKK